MSGKQIDKSIIDSICLTMQDILFYLGHIDSIIDSLLVLYIVIQVHVFYVTNCNLEETS
jgi:hypothetical protein